MMELKLKNCLKQKIIEIFKVGIKLKFGQKNREKKSI
jgi:hypothetical protein